MSWFDALSNGIERLAESDRAVGDALSRRKWLLAGAAAALGTATKSKAAPPVAHTRWLINRITMGWTPEEQLLADTLGYHGYLEYHLNYTAIDDSAVNALLAPYTLLIAPPYYLHGFNASIPTNQLCQATFLRATYSRRQLFERMVEFWTDHLNIDIKKADNPWIKLVDDRDVIRVHALGNFRDLIIASARSPSMLEYLDNADSVVGNPNENYARELMELHTMGVSGGYTQQDVVEVARAFTGWTVDQTNTQTKSTFRFDSVAHDTGSKIVLGQVIPAGGGYDDGIQVIDILMAHPSTANFIARKLCERFYSYSPPQSLINSVAATFTATNGDIKSMLRTLFLNANPATAPAKLKRPFHLVISALRASKASVGGSPDAVTSQLRQQLQAAGHEPFQWGTPDGYPDKLEHWSGLVIARWNFAAALMKDAIADVTTDVEILLAGAITADQVADKINEVVCGGALTVVERNRIRDYLLPGIPTKAKKAEAVALAISAPSFQWY